MAFIPVPNVTRAVFVQQYFGQPVINTLHFLHGDDPDEADLAAVGAGLRNWWDAKIKSFVPPDLVLVEVVCTRLTDETQIQAVTGSPIVGTNATGEPMPGNVALCATFKTGNIGRSFRGRWYQCGIPTSDLLSTDSNEVTSAVAAAWLTSFNFLNSYVANMGNPPVQVIVSRYHNKAARSQGIATVVTTRSINTALDSQRRRLSS